MTTSATPTMKALVLRNLADGPSIETVPIPSVAPGSAVVRILSITTAPFLRDMYLGKFPAALPLPLTIGTSAIGRIVETGPDATKLVPGDLVFIDMILRSRDNVDVDFCLAGANEGFTPGAKKLMADGYRDWTYAEYCLAPLENLTRLDEERLLGSPGLGYRLEELNLITTPLVPFGGLRDMGLKPGETVIIAPATGRFGGAGVFVALALGAKVIALGRDTTKLAQLKARVPAPERLDTVEITGDVQEDTASIQKLGQIDAYLDIGPMQAFDSPHIKSCLAALKHGGRVSLMGGYRQDVALPYRLVVSKNLKIGGRWGYEREAVPELIKMIECGVLKLGKRGGYEITGGYSLEQWREAWDASVENAGFGKEVVVMP